MTLYFSLVFLLLVAEIALFVLLIVPLPFTVKRKLFTFLSENPVIAKLQYGLKITFIFILILFIDSVNRVWRVQYELVAATEGGSNSGRAVMMGHERLEVQARKFYSQRNMYLCGSTLFLSLILNRMYVMILEVLRLEQKIKEYEGTEKDTKQAEKLAVAGEPGEIARLKKELAAKDRDLENLKKQSEGLSREYNDLSDKYNAMIKDETPKKDR